MQRNVDYPSNRHNKPNKPRAYTSFFKPSQQASNYTWVWILILDFFLEIVLYKTKAKTLQLFHQSDKKATLCITYKPYLFHMQFYSVSQILMVWPITWTVAHGRLSHHRQMWKHIEDCWQKQEINKNNRSTIPDSRRRKHKDCWSTGVGSIQDGP